MNAMLPTEDQGELITCQTCDYLDRVGQCEAARRGLLTGRFSFRYSPVTDLPRRCEGYLPQRTEPDQRPGKQRWPTLINHTDMQASAIKPLSQQRKNP